MKISKAKVRTPNSNLDPIRKNTSDTSLVTVFNDDRKGEFYYLSIESLLPYHKQARTVFNEEKIRELSLTIQEHGIRQPLTVIKSSQDTNKYEIISGERRFRAAKLINLKKVPCIILTDDSNAEEISIIENIQREDLHPIEMGIAYKELSEHKNLSLNKLSEALGVSSSVLKEHVQYSLIDPEIRDVLISENISERKVLRKILALKNIDERKQFLNSEINKRTSNIGKSYKSRKVKLLSAEILEGKLHFELKNLKRLDEVHRKEMKKFIETILESL